MLKSVSVKFLDRAALFVPAPLAIFLIQTKIAKIKMLEYM